jgi:C terminal of Calcineurin-like phosphoesterase/N terminal of Calcineurin-like phosphoesterase/Calcineurin-like phosphoesterase
MRYLWYNLTIILSLTSSLLFAGNQVKGTVFHDQNRNLQLDAGEKGIPGVLVSNQKEVVKTDEQGRYSLPVTERSIIFVIKPADYDLPVNSRNLPQFYYLHFPQGSPSLKYKGVEPTGPLPADVNFPLFSSTTGNNYTIVVFGDPQPSSDKEIGYIRDDIVAELSGTSAVCGITLGDNVFDDLMLYDYYLEVISQIGIPLYHVPGNHDENYDVPNDELAMETFKRYFGPNYYAFQYGKTHFIVMDDVEYKGQKENKYGGYQGMIGEKQLQWLKNYLSFIPDDELIVFTMHIPFYTAAGEDPGIRAMDREKLFSLLQNRQHLLALAGHMHTIEHHFLKPEQGWMGTAPFQQIICGAMCGAWWSGPQDSRGIPIADQQDGAPNGYHLFTFQGNTFKQHFKAAYYPADYQMRISQPAGKVKQTDLPEHPVLVNVFNGNEKSVVECRLDGQAPQPMTRVFMIDPYFQAIYQNNSQSYYDWFQPEATTHLWTVPLPSDLSPGIHKIQVISQDQYGDSYQAVRIFEVE